MDQRPYFIVILAIAFLIPIVLWIFSPLINSIKEQKEDEEKAKYREQQEAIRIENEKILEQQEKDQLELDKKNSLKVFKKIKTITDNIDNCWLAHKFYKKEVVDIKKIETGDEKYPIYKITYDCSWLDDYDVRTYKIGKEYFLDISYFEASKLKVGDVVEDYQTPFLYFTSKPHYKISENDWEVLLDTIQWDYLVKNKKISKKDKIKYNNPDLIKDKIFELENPLTSFD